jgi:hypothetical protein
MECKYCHYCKVDFYGQKDKLVALPFCDITHRVNPKSCEDILSDEEVKDMEICYNCQYWIGGGDWGLSCQKNYYDCSTNGFCEACKEFKKKNENDK